MTHTGDDDGSGGAATFGADAEATAALFARCGVLSLASVMGPGGCHEEGTTSGHE